MKLLSSILCSSIIFCEICCAFSFLQPIQHNSLQTSIVSRRRISTVGFAKVDDETEEKSTPAFDEQVRKSLFGEPTETLAEPVNILPTEQSSDEKRAAIQLQISQKVAALKKAGEWNDGPDVFGKDPLASQPIWMTMAAQLKSTRFETTQEFLTIYFLLLATTAFLTTYLLVLRDTFDSFIVWFVKNDFDNEFLQSLFNQS